MFWESFTLTLIIISYVIGVYNCYRVIASRRSPAISFAWILFHIFFPIIAVVIFVLFGRTQIYKKKQQSITETKKEIQQPSLINSTAKSGSHLASHYEKVFNKLNPLSKISENDVRILIDGIQTYEAIFKAIYQAKGYILIQYYILRSDRLGKELQKLLIKKANEGIKIYVLYDGFGSIWLSRKYIKKLKKAGIRVARFLPIASFKSFFNLNFRNHRKLVIVDGKKAFTGGLNFGEEYISRFYPRPKQTYWRDTHIEIYGPAVHQLEQVFLEDWEFTTTKKPKLASPAEGPEPKSPKTVQVIPSGPTDGFHVGPLLFISLINTAKKRLWIATPYFVPDANLLNCLELAVLRGVDVRLIIPHKADHRLVHWATLSFAEQAAQKGVDVYCYDKGFLHQKVLLVDDELTLIGTTNFDMRALYINFETNILIFDEKLNSETAAMLLNDQKHSVKYAQHSETQSVFVRLRGDLVRLVAPLL